MVIEERCELCGGGDFDLLHRQDFVLPGDVETHYDVSCCTGCGFAFARNLPSPAAYEAYYAANTRYTYEGSKNVSPAMHRLHADNFAFVDAALSGEQKRVLDVGCATGLLLSYFRAAGYDVLGVDPAAECRDIGGRLYNVPIVTASIASFTPAAQFDVVMLANVIEHLPNAALALARVGRWVTDGGFVFVQVPDAEHFGVDMKEPFLEFSVEHVKYFTRISLRRLLAKAGFASVKEQQNVVMVNGVAYPAITALFRRDEEVRKVDTPSDVRPLRDYIVRSRQKLADVSRTISALAESKEPVVVWGVGSLAARLMATTSMAHLNLRGFVDSASGLHGRTLHGLTIQSPASLHGQTTTVLVASYVWADAIRRTLRDELDYQGKIVTL